MDDPAEIARGLTYLERRTLVGTPDEYAYMDSHGERFKDVRDTLRRLGLALYYHGHRGIKGQRTDLGRAVAAALKAQGEGG